MRPGLVCALLASVAAGCAGAPRGAAFRSARAPQLERVFVGPDYYANRLFDWRLAGGRIECVEGAASKPMRTLHLVTRSLRAGEGELSASVRTGPLSAAGAAGAATWTGFLIGAGGPGVDPRTSALVHHWPAPGGGLIAALDGTGRLVLRDNEGSGDGRRGALADLGLAAWPLLARDAAAEPLDERAARDVVLRLQARPSKRGYALALSAHDPASGAQLRRLELDGVAPGYLEGNVALVSHASRAGSGPGYWFADWRVGGSKLEAHPERAFGPIVSALYTHGRGALKLTAQMAALGPDDTQQAALEVRRGGVWQRVATGRLDPNSWTIPFRVEPWDGTHAVRYRVVYDLRAEDGRAERHTYEGTLRAEPTDADELVLAGLSCMAISTAGDQSWTSTGFWFPHADLVERLEAHDPDVVFFAGDQIYESGLAGVVRQPLETALLDYQYHWYQWCWSFRDLVRDRPTVCLPDDHDVYHGNLWGAGGIKAEGPLRPLGDNGGYVMDPAFVNAVHATQTSHLPDPDDPTPVAQGISVYFTDWRYAGVSFGIVADRQWKDSASVLVPEGEVRNGWFQNRDFDPRDADVPGARLLGARQEAFLERWAADWTGGVRLKVLLSQTIFANVATLPADAAGDGVVPGLSYADEGEYVEGDRLAADSDSNGWPQSARDRALRAIRKGFALHVAGDQHLPSLTQYGVDAWGDAPYAFCVPAVANLWPRRWYPPEPGANRAAGAPRNTGDFHDGFGNKVTVLAVANPRKSGREPAALFDRMPGYGVVRLDKAGLRATLECWPRWADPDDPAAAQYPGWPVTIDMLDNYGRAPAGHLPELRVRGMTDPVVQVVDELTGEVVYTGRRRGDRFALPVFAEGDYSVRVGEPGTPRWRTLERLRPGHGEPLRVDLSGGAR